MITHYVDSTEDQNFNTVTRSVEGDFKVAREMARKNSEWESLYLIEDSENIETYERAATIGLEFVESSIEPDVVLIASAVVPWRPARDMF